MHIDFHFFLPLSTHYSLIATDILVSKFSNAKDVIEKAQLLHADFIDACTPNPEW